MQKGAMEKTHRENDQSEKDKRDFEHSKNTVNQSASMWVSALLVLPLCCIGTYGLRYIFNFGWIGTITIWSLLASVLFIVEMEEQHSKKAWFYVTGAALLVVLALKLTPWPFVGGILLKSAFILHGIAALAIICLIVDVIRRMCLSKFHKGLHDTFNSFIAGSPSRKKEAESKKKTPSGRDDNRDSYYHYAAELPVFVKGFFIIASLLVALINSYYWGVYLHNTSPLQPWPSTEAKVEQIISAPRSQVIVEYGFTVNGKQYTGGYNTGANAFNPMSLEEVEALYPPSSAMTVFYNPYNPEYSCYDCELNLVNFLKQFAVHYIGFLIWLLLTIFICLNLLAFIVTLPKTVLVRRSRAKLIS